MAYRVYNIIFVRNLNALSTTAAQAASNIMSRLLIGLLLKNACIHIDKIHVTGPCRHKPLGKVFFRYDEEVGFVAAGASANTQKLKGSADDAFIKSKDVQDDGYAYQLEIHCCPPKVLQKHNVFGHSSLVDYAYAVFDHLTGALALAVDPHDREEWRQGGVWLTEVHLTGNFGCAERDVLPIIEAIDANNSEGKHRDGLTCITLGFTGKRRSKHHTVTIYYKRALLASEWKRPGQYQSKLIQETTDAIRAEVKLYSMGLKARGLQYGAKWKDIDVAALFFETFSTYKINNAIQPVLTEDELAVLTKAELRVYRLWLSGQAVSDMFSSRTTAWKYVKSIYDKTGIDVSGDRRPEALPLIHLAEIFRPANVLPIPGWAFGTPHYYPPTQQDVGRRRGSGIGDAPVAKEPPEDEEWV